MPLSYRPEKDPFAIFLASIFVLFIFLGILNAYIPSSIFSDREKIKSECSVSGIGFHSKAMDIKFNSDGRFNSIGWGTAGNFWGTWEQVGNEIITTIDRSTTGMGIGQQNTYIYDCDKLTRFGTLPITLYKD